MDRIWLVDLTFAPKRGVLSLKRSEILANLMLYGASDHGEVPDNTQHGHEGVDHLPDQVLSAPK